MSASPTILCFVHFILHAILQSPVVPALRPPVFPVVPAPLYSGTVQSLVLSTPV
jgi:hypothetical protein